MPGLLVCSGSPEGGPATYRDKLIDDALSTGGERLVLNAEGLGRVDVEGARRLGVHLAPGSEAPELDGDLAERTGVEVHTAADGPDLQGLVPVAVTPDKLGEFTLGLELAVSSRRLEAAQSRRQVAVVRAERRYVVGRDRQAHGGVALPTMSVRGLVPRHPKGLSEGNLTCRVQ